MHRSILLKSILFVALLIIGLVCFSQQPKLKFKYITSKDGLTQNYVIAIQQDNNGFMWFGTQEGLCRYDGYSFKTYLNDPKKTTSLSNNYINCICKDHNGNIWVGTVGGLDYYDRNLDIFKHFQSFKVSYSKLNHINVYSIIEDDKHNLWIGTINDGLLRLDSTRTLCKQYLPESTNPHSLGHSSVRNVIQDKQNRIWIGLYGGGLNLYNPSTDDFTHFENNPSDKNSISCNYVCYLYEDKSDQLWIGTEYGLNVFNRSRDRFDHYLHDPHQPYSLSKNAVISILQGDDGMIWVGTENGGLCLFDPQRKLFYTYQVNDKTSSINSITVNSMFKDKNGNIWLGTYAGGVNVYFKSYNIFEHFRHLNDNTSLSHNNVLCFDQDYSGNIWVGTDGGGLNLFHSENNTFTYFQHKEDDPCSLGADNVLTILSDSHKNLWVGTWDGGLNLFNPATRKFKHFYYESKKPQSISSNKIGPIYEDHFGNLWIGAYFGGLDLFDFKTEHFIHHAFDQGNPASISTNNITVITEDKFNNLWIGTQGGGLNLYDRKNNQFIHFKHIVTDTCSLADNTVLCSFKDHNGDLWFGCNRGLNKLDAVSRKFTVFTTENGLPNNMVVGILEDSHGYLWVSTNNGLAKFDPKTKSCRVFSMAHGLQDLEFKRSSCMIDNKGYMYFGGINGFNRFYPDSVQIHQNIPPILLTDFQVFNKPVEVNDKSGILSKVITETDQIHLTYKQSVFSIEFAALNYNFSNEIEYAYKLEHFDKEWNYVGKMRIASYTNLNAGRYLFKVKCKVDGVWGKEEQKLIIFISPPFWKTLWFIAIIIIIIISSIILYMRIRMYNLTVSNKILESRVKERTLSLEETNLLLEEKQEEINIQNEELLAQRDSLSQANDFLTKQKELITHQNSELDLHRNKLEKMVEERTNELTKALYNAEESDRLKTSFLANMSHEIRTPLNAIIGFSSILSDSFAFDEEKKEMIDIIISNGNTLLFLINDILDLSKIQADELRLSYSPANLSELLYEVSHTVILEAERKSINLYLGGENFPENTIIQCDSIRLKQVFLNLLTNALKFTHSGEIVYGVHSMDNQITFFVKDTGIGIPEAIGNKIFDRFMKIESDKSMLYRGNGLGLTICRSLVNIWGGKIWFTSEVNKGTTFFFTHPLQKHLPIKEDHFESDFKMSQIPDLTSKMIAIAEDEDANYKVFYAYLKNTHATVFWAKNGLELVNFLKGNHADIVFIDVKMPVMDGMEAIHKIREFNREIPIIAQTAFAFEYDLDRIIQSGFNAVLIKPIKLNDLFAVVHKFMKT